MLERIKFEAIDFGSYESLRSLFLESTEEPNEIETLDLSRHNAPALPPAKAMEEMPRLTQLILSCNRIQRFEAQTLTKYAPQLEVLDLSSNLINVIDDLSDLGSLKELRLMEFLDNPVCTYMKRIVIIQNLLYPKRYEKYDAVRILSAEYNIPPNPKLSSEEEQRLRENIIINSKLPEELDIDDAHELVSKYSHKNTIAKYSVEMCPVPRKSRFPNLIRVNGEIITKFDCMRVAGTRNLEEIVVTKSELEERARNAEGAKNNKDSQKAIENVQKPHQHVDRETHEQYLRRYKRRLEETYSDAVRPLMAQQMAATAEEYDIFQDLKERKIRAQAIPRTKYEPNLWEPPEDVLLKDATYAVSIKGYKKMLKEHEEEKIAKKKKREDYFEERRKESRERVEKKLKKMGVADVQELCSDEELSEGKNSVIFRKKQQQKPHLNLEANDEFVYPTSESEVSEKFAHSHDGSVYERQEGGGGGEASVRTLTDAGGADEPFIQADSPRSPVLSDNESKKLSVSNIRNEVLFGESSNNERDSKTVPSGASQRRAEAHTNSIADYTELKKQLEEELGKVGGAVPPLQRRVAPSNGNGEGRKGSSEARALPLTPSEKRDIAKDNTKHSTSPKPTQKSSENGSGNATAAAAAKQESSEGKADASEEDLTAANVAPFNIESSQVTTAIQSELVSRQVTPRAASNQQYHHHHLESVYVGNKKKLNEVEEDAYHLSDNTRSIGVNAAGSNFVRHVSSENSLAHPMQGEQNSIYALPTKNYQFSVNKTTTSGYVEKAEELAKHDKVEKERQLVKQKSLKTAQKIFSKPQSVHSNEIDRLKVTPNKELFLSEEERRRRKESLEEQEEQLAGGSSAPDGLKRDNTIKISTNKRPQTSKNVVPANIDLSNVRVRKVEFKGNLREEKYQRAELDIESLLPTAEQGMAEDLRQQVLFDFNGDEHARLKLFKRELEESINLRRSVHELNSKIEFSGGRKEVYDNAQEQLRSIFNKNGEESRVISYDKMFAYLATQKNFAVENSYDPANRLICGMAQNRLRQEEEEQEQRKEALQSRKKSTSAKIGVAGTAPNSSALVEIKKLNNHDLREIFYRANDMDPQDEPKITEKEVREMLNVKSLPVEQKLLYFDYLEVIEEIKSKRLKPTEQHLKRVEEKEMERAESNAHLAYHYSRLKKYMSEGEIDRFNKMLSIGEDKKDTLFGGGGARGGGKQINAQEGASSEQVPGEEQQTQMQQSKGDNKLAKKEPEDYRLREDRRLLEPKTRSEMEDLRQAQEAREKIDPERKGFFSTLQRIQEYKNEGREESLRKTRSEIKLVGPIVEAIPNINEIVNQKKPFPYQKLSFEEMMDAALRRLSSSYAQNGTRSVSIEEELIRYAQELEQKTKASEDLKKKIDAYIHDNRKKLDEFFQWNAQEIVRRADPNYCFYDYVKRRLKDS